MIDLQIDEANKTVWFKGPVNFEKAQMVMQAIADVFGWSRQDATFGGSMCSPTVEPGAPIPIPDYVTSCTTAHCGHCHESRLSENAPLWEGNPNA